MVNNKLMVLSCFLLLNSNHSFSQYPDIKVTEPNATTTISDPCRNIMVAKAAVNHVLKINGRVEGDVVVDADACEIEVLKNGSFGSPCSSNNDIRQLGGGNVFFNGPVIVNGAIFVNGKRFSPSCCSKSSQLTVNGEKFKLSSSSNKSLDLSVVINAANAVVYPSINGSVETTSNGVFSQFISSIGGSVTSKGNDFHAQGSIGGSVVLEGDRSTVNMVGGSAQVTGDNCAISGHIGGSAQVAGSNCTIHGCIGGSARVAGSNCTIHGHVGGSAQVIKDTIIKGFVGGTKRVL